LRLDPGVDRADRSPYATSAAIAELRPIVIEPEPVVIAVSIEDLSAAVELTHTGHQPARLVVYVDRRNNVVKFSQGEFVTVAKLEAVFGNSPLMRKPATGPRVVGSRSVVGSLA
jgi:hypothetical protein